MVYHSLFATVLILVTFSNSALSGIRALTSRLHSGHSQYPLDEKNPAVFFSEKWQVLGPFRCGTREAVWGADPLEYWGGFNNLSYDKLAEFSSPLATDGIVRWDLLWANVTHPLPEQSRAELLVSFPEVDWKFLQSVYGWSALQYQAWVRGSLNLSGLNNQTVAVYSDGVLEFSVDGRRYFGGDFYSFRRAPLILDLTPGEHVVELRLIRDVRALGGQGDPTINVVLETEVRHEVLSIDERSLLVPETTDGKLGSAWASVNVQNNVAEWVEIISISSPDVPLVMKGPLHVAPHQIRPLAFRFAAGNVPRTMFPLHIHYQVSQGGHPGTQSFRAKLVDRSLSQPQRLTYLHPASIVSYSILRPPPLETCASNQSNTSLPIIIGLHGAGLEADSAQAREMLDAAYGICVWMLFPSGVTAWSGDDWHTWGAADIKPAVSAVSQWMEAVGWKGPGILADDWIVIGHSNGGQGVWFLATHHPDNVIAAAPVSGYSSIENYVSYNMWQDSEPLISSVLHRSRTSYKHELLLENIAGMPILQQHGSEDTNVPAYHSRLMHEQLEKIGWPSEYIQLPGKGHWFEGVMTTPPLLKFYHDSLRSIHNEIPFTFTLNVPSSGDMTSKGGIYVDQLQSPDMIGRLQVKRDIRHGIWYVQTHNIHRFHLSHEICETEGSIILVLDETSFRFKVHPRQCGSTWYIKDADGRWMSSKRTDWQSPSQRYGRQVGAMDAILRTKGLFTIEKCSAGVEHIALQISRNLLQYFAADSLITSQCNSMTTPNAKNPGTILGNVITLSLRDEMPDSTSSLYPVHVTDNRTILYRRCFRADLEEDLRYDSDEACHSYTFDHKPGMGALFLRPLENERLELVVWGADMDGLEQAARLVPTLTGAGQPEFLILSDSCRWNGHAGLYAAGHFDKFWQISPGSYLSDGM